MDRLASLLARILIATLLCILVSYPVVAGVARAQDNEPSIASISPETIIVGQPFRLTVKGSRFAGSISAGLYSEDRQVTSLQLDGEVKPTEFVLIGTAPDATERYQLRITFNDRQITDRQWITVREQRTLEITEVLPSPPVLYNTEKAAVKQLTIRGLGFTTPLTVTLGDLSLTPQFDDQNEPTAITVTLPVGTAEGSYPLTLIQADGQSATYTGTVEVRGAVLPQIDIISPTRVLRFTNVEQIFEIYGKNLASVNDGEFPPAFSSSATCNNHPYYGRSCELKSSPDVITVILDCSCFTDARENEWSLYFPDSTDPVVIPTKITVVDRVTPWNEFTWFLFAIILLLGVTFAWATLGQLEQNNYLIRKNERVLRLPSYRDIHALFTGLLFSVALLAGVIAVVWRAFNGSNPTNLDEFSGTFVISCTLSSITAFLPWSIAIYAQRFGLSIRPALRFIPAALLSVLALTLPWALIYEPWLVIAGEAGLLVVLWVLSTSILRASKRQLQQQQRKHISNTELRNEIDAVLRQKGEVSIGDIPGLPLERIQEGLRTFHANELEPGGRTLIGNESIRLNRNSAVAALSLAIADLRSAHHSSSPGDHQQAVATLLTQLKQVFNLRDGHLFDLGDVPTVFEVVSVAEPELESILPTPFPLILFNSVQAISQDDLAALKAMFNRIDVDRRFGILVTIDADTASYEQIDRTLRSGADRESIAVLNQEICYRLLAGAAPIREALMRELGQQIDLLIFSPYRSKEPTRLDMFYGRDRQAGLIADTVKNGSAAVLGARRIGKTSVLKTVQRTLEERGYSVYFLDAYSAFDYRSFFRRIGLAWNIPEARELARQKTPEPTEFEAIVALLKEQAKDRPLVFIFDEIDRLLEFDISQTSQLQSKDTPIRAERNEQLFRLFRGLSQEKTCQFIFSGERSILDRMANPRSSLFNFANTSQLGLIDALSVERLVREPMQLISVKLDEPEVIVSLIHHHTAGHPNLVQFLCERLIAQISSEGNEGLAQRVITTDMVRNLVVPDSTNRDSNGITFRDYFLQTFWSQATPAEKAITVYVASVGTAKENQIYTWLHDQGFAISGPQLQSGLRYLQLNQLLRQDAGGFTIQPQTYHDYLSYETAEHWLKIFREEKPNRNEVFDE